MGEVRRWGSGGPWEDAVGYSRVVAAGPFVMTAGCTAVVEGEPAHPGDPYHQTRTAFGIALRGLETAGCTIADVVHTRMYVVHARDCEAVGRAHGDLFRDVRPATTMVVVQSLIDTQLLVEVEVVAYRG